MIEFIYMTVDPYKIQLICSRCNGEGELLLEGIMKPCPDCEGDGKLGEGTIEGAEQINDLSDKVNDALGKLDDILEKLNE